MWGFIRARSPTVIELFGVQKKRTPGAKLAKRHSGSSYVPVQRMWKLNSDILDNLEGQFRTSQRTLMTFDSWRRRMFYVKRRRDVSWALVLFSQKTGQLELSCELASVNGVATIEDGVCDWPYHDGPSLSMSLFAVCTMGVSGKMSERVTINGAAGWGMVSVTHRLFSWAGFFCHFHHQCACLPCGVGEGMECGD